MTMKISKGETVGLYWLFPITLRNTQEEEVRFGLPESLAYDMKIKLMWAMHLIWSKEEMIYRKIKDWFF